MVLKMTEYRKGATERRRAFNANPPLEQGRAKFVSDGSITWGKFYKILCADLVRNRRELAEGKTTKARREILEQRIGSATRTILKFGGEVP